VHEWHIARAERAARSAVRDELRATPPDGANGAAGSRTPSERSQARRAERVAAGLDELDRWLADQVRAGIAGLGSAGYAYWDAMAARLVDAQAGTAAGVVRRIAQVAGSPERLLGELALLRLLVSGYRRLDTLPEDLAASVRLRVGLPMPSETVLAGPRVRDRWQVLGVRDEIEEQLTVRRAWLRGADSGRPALVLSFALAGQPLTADLLVGTEIDADLCFYPGGRQVRALVAERHGAVATIASLAPAMPIADALAEHAEALAADPWVERWPVLLDGVVPVRDGRSWHLVDASGAGVPVDPAAGTPWRLVGLAGGRPVPVAGEWSAAGFRPLSAWAGGRLVKL
jgi:hypothetical protein